MNMKKSVLLYALLFNLVSFGSLQASSGMVTSADNRVALFSDGNRVIVKAGTLLPNRFVIETPRGGKAKLIFRDGTELIIYERAKAEFSLLTEKNKKQLIINHGKGVLWAKQAPAGWNVSIQHQGTITVPEKASFKIAADNQGLIQQLFVFGGKVAVAPDEQSGKTRQINAAQGARLQFKPGFQVEDVPAKISVELNSEQNLFFLPSSGQMEAEVNILIKGLPADFFKYSSLQGTLVADNHKILISDAQIFLKKEVTSIKIQLLETGESTLYFILNPDESGIGGEGRLTFSVLEAGHPKTLKIKTSDGAFNIHLLPKVKE